MRLFMLDTDCASYLIRGKFPALDARVSALPPKQLCISAVTRGELLFGLHLKAGAHRLAHLIDQFLQRVQCLPWDDAAAAHFAAIAAGLHRAGTPIGSLDAMIAGHARATGATLVTNDERHFARVPDLEFENWCVEK